MSKLSDLPHDRPVATLMFLLSLMVLGLVALFRLPLDFMPTVEPPFVNVRVSYPGSHPLENLRQIVEPLEDEVATVSELKGLYSEAESGSARVRAEFDWSTDLNLKKLEVREAVDRALPLLPEDIGRVRIETFQSGPADGAVIEARISAQRDLSESWELLERRIRRPLERIRGVARVDLGGVEPQQVRIAIDPEALRRHDVQPRELARFLQDSHLDLDLGAVHGDSLRYDVRSLGRFRSTEEIERLRLPGRDVRVGDLAQVSIVEPRVDYGRHLDREFAISLEIFKEPTANTVDTVDRVMAEIAEIERDPQLEGIKLLVWNNAGSEIRRSLAGLRDAGLFGGLLAAAVLYFFLRRVRTTLVVAVAIPFSLLVTCGLMYLMDLQFNVLTLLGLMLGVGMLVDNAVVVIENIYRLQGQGLDATVAARRGTREVTLAVLAATATTVCVWAWLFLADRDPMTIYLGQIALVICAAVFCSLIISLTFIPLAAARFVPSRPVPPGFLLKRLVPAYRGLLAWTLRHRLITLVALLAIAGTAAYPIAKIEKSSEPKERQVFAQVFLRSVDPADKEVMEGHVNVLEDWIEAHREELGYDSLYAWFTDNAFAIIRVYLKPEQTTEEAINRLTAQLREGVPEIPGVEMTFGERDWWRHGGTEGRRQVALSIHGEDPEFLQEVATDVEQRLLGIPDVVDAFGPSIRGQQEARVVVDAEKARALGVTPEQVAQSVALIFRGRNLPRFQHGDTELEMLIALPEDLRPGLAALTDLPIPRDDGEPVALGAVARLEMARIDPAIDRENRQTTAYVTAEFDSSITTEEAQARVAARMAEIDLPEGYGWSWGRWGRRHEEGLATMLQGVVLSLAAVILLMAALFESLSQPLAIIITLPLAFFGGFWLLWLLGYELDVVGFTGIIILIGIVVNNGIVLVDHVNQLRSKGMERREALITGCGDRLRPVLMTAITTIFGLIPLAASRFTVAAAYIDSLAVAVIGGLTTSTLFTLVGLPVWYSTLEDLTAAALRALPRRLRRPREAVAEDT